MPITPRRDDHMSILVADKELGVFFEAGFLFESEELIEWLGLEERGLIVGRAREKTPVEV